MRQKSFVTLLAMGIPMGLALTTALLPNNTQAAEKLLSAELPFKLYTASLDKPIQDKSRLDNQPKFDTTTPEPLEDIEGPKTQVLPVSRTPANLIKARVSLQQSKYVLGPGDLVSIKVNSLPQYDQELRIRPDGYVSIQPFGEYYLAGTQIDDLQGWLEEQFKFYLLKPQVTINLKELRPATVYVLGAVQHPGSYEYFRRETISSNYSDSNKDNTQITLANVINKAGGVTLKADVRHVRIRHAQNQQVQTVNLAELLAGEKAGADTNVYLMPDDTVEIPMLTEAMDWDTFRLISRSTMFQNKFPVLVLGEVQHQGEVMVDANNNSLNAALAIAGGFNTDKAQRKTILVQRPNNNGGFHRLTVDRDRVQFEMMPGDVIYVAGTNLAKAEKVLKIFSEIGQPFFFGVNGANTLTGLIK